ncbi:MAG: hypothetical protein EXQ97_07865 [Alphaproteobacteria bacterium]|nr:hypothetical protein [Alphaproteobacteria bacterium]
MDSEADIHEAIRDLRTGRFVAAD